MRRLVGFRGVPVVLAVFVVAAAGGTYALASGSGTIRACVRHGTRALYKAPCHRGDRRISWSKVGPQGPRGPAGTNGTNGTGPGYAVHNDGPVVESDANYHPIATLPIPAAGAYAISAKVEVTSSATAGTYTSRCQLIAGSDSDESAAVANSQGGAIDAVVALEVAHTFTAPGTALLQCRGEGSQFTFAKVIGIHLTSVTDAAVTG